jgi:hypothetical protein
MERHEDTDDEQPAGALTTQPHRAGQMARQDFSGSSLSMTSSSTEALVASARADTEARWIMAMRNPRDMDVVRQSIIAECKRPGFAEVATYSRPVGKEQNDAGEWVDSFADGLSIRFAEVAMRCMGNMQCKAKTVYDDAKIRMITVTAVDYETNATWDIDLTIPKTVERRKLKRGQRPIGERLNSYGDRVFIVEANDQQVHTVCAAEISKAARTAILRLVPGHLQDEAFDLCRKTAANREAKDPNAAKNRMIDAFAECGIKVPAIVEWLGHDIDSGTREEYMELSKIISAVRERELIWAEVLAERIASRGAKQPAKPAPPTTAAQASPAPAPRQSEPSVPPAEPQREARPAPAPRQSTGKGTAALKGALTKPAPAPKPEPPVTIPRPADDDEDPEAEPGWMGRPEVPPGTPPPPPGFEDRKCASTTCNATVEVEIGTPPGVRCYACSQA